MEITRRALVMLVSTLLSGLDVLRLRELETGYISHGPMSFPGIIRTCRSLDTKKIYRSFYKYPAETLAKFTRWLRSMGMTLTELPSRDMIHNSNLLRAISA